MNKEEKDITFIVRYMNFQLSEKELIAFEERMKTDEAFVEKVALYEVSEDTVRESFYTDKENERLQKWQIILEQKKNSILPNTNNIPWKWIGGIAAGFLLIISLWHINRPLQKSELTALLEDSWNKKVGLDFNALRGTNIDAVKQIISSAFKEYEEGKYSEAMRILKKVNTSTTNYEDVLLLRGLSLYKIGSVELSLQTLDSLSTYSTGRKAKVALWYKGLIYLDQNEMELAKQFLKIPDTKNEEIKLK